VHSLVSFVPSRRGAAQLARHQDNIYVDKKVRQADTQVQQWDRRNAMS
jgi:hypothetical protein